jgi:hypothetical protein
VASAESQECSTTGEPAKDRVGGRPPSGSTSPSRARRRQSASPPLQCCSDQPSNRTPRRPGGPAARIVTVPSTFLTRRHAAGSAPVDWRIRNPAPTSVTGTAPHSSRTFGIVSVHAPIGSRQGPSPHSCGGVPLAASPSPVRSIRFSTALGLAPELVSQESERGATAVASKRYLSRQGCVI